MNRKKYLIKNVAILTISQFGSKILSFLLIPLYTNVLTIEEYGIYDLFYSTVVLLIPFLTLCVSDATLRFPLDPENDKKGIFTISIRRFLLSAIVLCVPLTLNHYFPFSILLKDNAMCFTLMYCIQALSGICINFARGLEGIKEVGISGIICSAIMLVLNIIFLVVLHIGLLGYFMANIIGPLVQTIYLFISLKLWKYVSIKNTYSDLEKRMTSYSVPLIANTTAWWINSSSDRYIVTWLSGVAANGIYSVSYKIPSILNVFQSIFNQAWTLSAVKEYDDKDSNGFFSGTYNLYNYSMILVCSILIIGTRIIAKLMYANDFYVAWKYVPWLLISVIFGAISGYLGGIFAAVKDTKIFAQTTVVTAIVNTILNIILVSLLGPIGAAFATLISYWLTYMIRVHFIKRYIEFNVNIIRDQLAYGLLILQSVLIYVYTADNTIYFMLEFIIFICINFLFRNEVIKIFNIVKKGLIRK